MKEKIKQEIDRVEKRIAVKKLNLIVFFTLFSVAMMSRILVLFCLLLFIIIEVVEIAGQRKFKKILERMKNGRD